MANDLTIVLTHWQRPDNLRQIIDALHQQTCKPTMFLWCNSRLESLTDCVGAVDWFVESSRNMHLSPATWMMKQAQTDYVAKLDDDLLPADAGLFAGVLDAFSHWDQENLCVGSHGMTLLEGRTYAKGRHYGPPRNNVSVDIVKGRLMVFRTKEILAAPDHQLTPHTDIVLSAWLAGRRRQRHRLLATFCHRLKDLPTGAESYCWRDAHMVERNELCQAWLLEVAAYDQATQEVEKAKRELLRAMRTT